MNAKQTLAQNNAELDRLKAENAKLRAEQRTTFELKVSQKGAISAYGMGRFPVTLYAEQWEKVLSRKDEIVSFIALNAEALKRKPAVEAVAS